MTLGLSNCLTISRVDGVRVRVRGMHSVVMVNVSVLGCGM